MNLHAYVGDQYIHIDQAEKGWEWVIFYRRRDRPIQTGVAKSLEAAKIAAALAAEVPPENINWTLIGPGAANEPFP
jgi:hypothetical protein